MKNKDLKGASNMGPLSKDIFFRFAKFIEMRMSKEFCIRISDLYGTKETFKNRAY